MIAVFMTYLIAVLLVFAPPVCVWRALSRSSGKMSWTQMSMLLLMPSMAGYCVVSALWLIQYHGQCGGWVGESYPCNGFGQYVVETFFWAALTMMIPALMGIAMGIAILIFRSIRRRITG